MGIYFDINGGYPEMKSFNGLHKDLSEAQRYFMQRGISEWSLSEDYPKGAYVQHIGKAWRAQAANAGKEPSVDEVWDECALAEKEIEELVKRKGHFYSQVNKQDASQFTFNDFGRRVWVDNNSPTTFTLPEISNINGSGQTITIWNVKSSAITISVGNSSDNISIPMSTVKSFKLMPTESVTMIVEQNNSWHATGDGMLKYSLLFRSSVTENGWGYQPSGLIEQWGACNVSGNGSVDGGYLNNFSIPFPNKCINIQLTHSGFSPGSVGVFSALVLNNNSQFRAYSSVGNVYPAGTAYYRAIGY
ncbi:gp53-like domain-containing protein [Limnobaculum xujianqingii]